MAATRIWAQWWTTTSVPTVINCRAILTPFIGNSPGLPYPFIGIVLSFGSSAQSQGNPTSSGHLTPFIGRPYILNLFMLVRLPGVWPVRFNPLTQHPLMGESLNLSLNFIFISHKIFSCISHSIHIICIQHSSFIIYDITISLIIN